MEQEAICIPDRKRARRTASLCAFATVAVFALSYGLAALYRYLTRNLTQSVLTGANASLIVNVLINDLIAMPLCWLIFLRRIPKNETLAGDVPDRTPLRVRTLLFYLPCVYALAYAGGLTGQLIGLLKGEGLNNVLVNTVMGVDPWVTILCAAIIGPVAEELFFRKALIDRLSQFHPTDAILLSALLFGMIHGNVTQFLYAFPIGVLLGIIYWRTKNIRFTILLHIGMNVIGGVLPQLVQMLQSAGQTNEILRMIAALAMMAFASSMLGLVAVGVIFLIRFRRRFLPIESPLPRCRKPFYVNVGWFVACTVFTALFVYVEWIA